jgi:hypothetical protein
MRACDAGGVGWLKDALERGIAHYVVVIIENPAFIRHHVIYNVSITSRSKNGVCQERFVARKVRSIAESVLLSAG